MGLLYHYNTINPLVLKAIEFTTTYANWIKNQLIFMPICLSSRKQNLTRGRGVMVKNGMLKHITVIADCTVISDSIQWVIIWSWQNPWPIYSQSDIKIFILACLAKTKIINYIGIQLVSIVQSQFTI